MEGDNLNRQKKKLNVDSESVSNLNGHSNAASKVLINIDDGDGNSKVNNQSHVSISLYERDKKVHS